MQCMIGDIGHFGKSAIILPAASAGPPDLTRGAAVQSDHGATRARNVRRYGYSASRAPCHTVLLAAAPAVFQPRGQALPKVGIIKKVARSIQSNATVQVLPGLAGDVPSPSLIMRTKGQQNVKANGA
jgi:hypothetical protein